MINTLRKRRCLAAVLFALLLIFCATLAGGGFPALAASVDDNYFFKSVSVSITVNKDKTFDVTETLQTEFLESGINTGIIRDIQHESKTTRIIDGKTYEGKRYFAGLENVSVTLDGGEAKVTRSFYGAFHSIKMQKPSGYMTAGTHTFVLKYTYDMGDDKINGFDDFTLDVLGYAMAKTEEFEANVIFPEGTDLSAVSFRTNDKAVWEPDGSLSETARVSGNEIYLHAFPAAANKGYTVQVILPDGYFGCSLTFYPYYVAFAVLALLGMAACVIIFLIGTLNKKVLAPVEYMPPKDVDIMHYSAAWHKEARYRDIGALVLQWAAMGLITIEKDGKRDLILKSDDRLKNKEQRDELLKGMTRREKNLFAAMMFNAGSASTFSTKEFKKRLKSSKRYTYECSEKLVENGNKPKPYKFSRNAVVTALSFAGLVPSFAIVLYFCILQDFYVFLVFFLFFAAGTFVGTAFWRTKVILMLIFPLSFYGGLYFIFAYIFAMSLYDYAGLLIIAPVWWALCLFVCPCFIKGVRSKEGLQTYTKLKGFKDFLLLTELSRIQLVFDENPGYFAEILPYCYIMGISKKVKKRFAPLNFIPPSYVVAGLDPDQIGRCASDSCSHHTSYSAMGGGGGGGGSSGGGGGGGSSGGGGGGGGSRGC